MKTIFLRSTTLYGMTINDYYKVIKANQKTALVQQIGKIVIHDEGAGQGKSLPNSDQVIGAPFKAYIRIINDRVYYVSKRFVSGKAVLWEAQADFYNTYD